MNNRTLLIALIGVILVIAGITAGVMISAASYMNRAADYARAHVDELMIPSPVAGATPYPEPPVRVESVARYGEVVEVQVTRRYNTARSPEALFTVTYFYTPAGEGWQLIPAPDSFWGEIKTTQGAYAIVIHPQRDQKLIDNLIKALDAALSSACERWECQPNSAPITLHFVTDPAIAEPLSYLTPRLTGIPMSREANDAYLSSIAADTLGNLAIQLGKSSSEARAEMMRQNLYLP